MEATQLDFGFSVDNLDSFEVCRHHHMRCEHDASSTKPIVEAYKQQQRYMGEGEALVSGVSVLSGRGIDKIVFSLPCGYHVLKVDRGVHNQGNQVAQEIENWEFADDSARQYLCPIDAYGDDWIIARRADTRQSGDDKDELIGELESVLSAQGFRDIHHGNVGELNGRPVLIDYGIGTLSRSYASEAA